MKEPTHTPEQNQKTKPQPKSIEKEKSRENLVQPTNITEEKIETNKANPVVRQRIRKMNTNEDRFKIKSEIVLCEIWHNCFY